MTFDRVFDIAILILSARAFVACFEPKYRDAARWIRTAHFLVAPLTAAWGSIGLVLDFTELTRRQFVVLDQLKWTVCGMAVGLLVLLLLSPDYRRLRRAQTSSL